MTIIPLKICFLVVLGTSGLSACSFSSNPPNVAQTLTSTEVFLARGRLGGADFEHYKIDDTTLYYECGTYEKGAPTPRETHLLELSDGDTAPILDLAEQASTSPLSSITPPEGVRTIFKGGDALFTFTRDTPPAMKVRTSLDSLTEDPQATVLHQLVTKLRSLPATPPCENWNFYGLARKVPQDAATPAPSSTDTPHSESQ